MSNTVTVYVSGASEDSVRAAVELCGAVDSGFLAVEAAEDYAAFSVAVDVHFRDEARQVKVAYDLADALRARGFDAAVNRDREAEEARGQLPS